MPLATPRVLGLLVLALTAAPALAQSGPTYFTVTSPADDGNARDKAPGDGVCEDSFTGSNPSAEPRCTLRAAIDEANATSGEVVINLPGQLAGGQSGQYMLTRVAPNDASNTYEDANAYGDLDVGGTFSTLTLRGTGTPGPTVTIGPNDRILHLLSGTVRIERITLTGGTARAGNNGVSSPGMGQSVNGQRGADGGCLLVAQGVTATLDQVAVTNCATQSGGNGASPAAAGTKGGNAGRGGNGGGIANFGTLTVRRSFVAENGTGDAGSAGAGTAGSGGAVAGGNGGNAGSGGGIYSEGMLTVEASTVFNNTAGDPSAGAAGTNGGAAGAEGEGGSGGGIAVLNGASASLRNTIVAGNAAGDDTNSGTQPGPDLWDGSPADDDSPTVSFTPGTFQSRSFNLIGSNNSVEDAFPVGSGDNVVGTGEGDASSRIDPKISGQNQNQNEAIANYPLLSGSPAIDAGEFDSGASSPLRTDGRGFQRPAPGEESTAADIGAYEFMSAPARDSLAITELDAVTGTPDGSEFVEITNQGRTAVQLADYALVFFDGADNKAYRSINLQGELAPGAAFVLGNPGVMSARQTFGGTESNIRDGSGAVALYRGKASDYPTGASAGQNTDSRADVLVYDNTGGRAARGILDAGDLAGAFGVSEDDIASGDTEANSIQSDGMGGYTSGAPNPGTGVSVDAADGPEVGAFAFSAPAPNPARSSARIELTLAEAQTVRVDLYDALGRRVATLHDGAAPAGPLAVEIDARGLAPGVYVLRAASATAAATTRLTVVR